MKSKEVDKLTKIMEQHSISSKDQENIHPNVAAGKVKKGESKKQGANMIQFLNVAHS